MDRRGLADFLRSRRERLRPSDVGLPAGGTRRRTPGLRREEVAQLAHISTEYYTRLEQARGPRPSRRVLAALDRALRMTAEERSHLFQLAGEPLDPPPGPPSIVRPSILAMLERLPDAAMLVLDAKFDVLAWNPLAAALLGDFSAMPRRHRNIIRRHFMSPAKRRLDPADADRFSRDAVGRLRAASARYPGDPGIAVLLRDLLDGSAEFARLWATHDVDLGHHHTKTIRHPVVGPVTLNCDALTIPDQDQHVIVYTADPGTPAEGTLRLLRVVGTQRMDVPT